MKEELVEIVKAIDSCAVARRGTGADPVARVHCLFDGEPETYWFTTDYCTVKNLAQFGRFVPKNSKNAIRLQSCDVGSSFSYDQMTIYKRIKTHCIVLENRSNLQDRTISIAGDELLYQYRDIHAFLVALQQNMADIKNVTNHISALQRMLASLPKGKEHAHDRTEIKKSIDDLKTKYRILTKQQEDLKNITIYIRKQGEMRYSLIVDPIQTRIKSQNLYDGKTVIIDGGPGTGKSTTMIHRLAYLTDLAAIDEDNRDRINDYRLTATQRQNLRTAITSQRDWMFFSPSQLLKEYLADAMKKEGLKNLSSKVWNWKDYCRLILQSDYHLLETASTKAPFKVCHLTDTLFYQGSNIIQYFTNYYVGQLREIGAQLPQLNDEATNYSWNVIAKNIRQRMEQSYKYDLAGFVSLFNSLEDVYGTDCRLLLSNKAAAVASLSDEVCVLLNENKNVRTEVESLLDLSPNESEDEIEDNEVVLTETNDKLSREIQRWLEAYCHSRINKDYALSEEHQFVCESILPLLGTKYDAQLQKIGELVVFEQFAKCTKGVKAIMLNCIPARYKSFRTHLQKSKYEGCNLKLLREIKQRRNGRELHHQEQSLLLGFINMLVKQIKTMRNADIRHPYIDAYDTVARPIIGIDEATDFSACDIYAMQSLLTLDFNSLTLCGDMMQRLTSYGLKSWDELNGIVQNPTVVEMKTSYRQSVKLLEVARQLYKDTIGDTPNYTAYMKTKNVPAPLVFVDDNESSKIQWISRRIAEVFRAYGEQMPSIAIFVNDTVNIQRFIEILEKTDFFTKHGVKILDGTSEESKTKASHICVYPIEVVKGMEFDVVFFHNIDHSTFDLERLKRYIYVGVSRAAFFLGITLSVQNNEICRYFENKGDWFNI